uniref:Phosphorylated adapter RNA export protein n=1 Tax=Peronospora matthiolae TaxID=2874970 RepID=A0AAV1TVR7_9STRA
MDAARLPQTCAPNAAPPSEPQQQPERKKKHGKKPPSGHKRSSKRRRNHLKQPLTKDTPRMLSELLKEPKIALLHRVVKIVGPKVSWKLLRETLRLEKDDGQSVDTAAKNRPELLYVLNEASRDCKLRRRTAGGVFFTLLKEKVSKETYRTIYEVEDRKKKETKKRARGRQRQRMDKTLAALRFDNLTLAAQSATLGWLVWMKHRRVSQRQLTRKLLR